METPKVKHVVADAIAFFKNVQLQDIAENVYTSQGVVNEIRDSATRKRLAVLPYDLKRREPSTEALQVVSDFARKTGDYSSLSAVDLRVIALAYQITKENIGVDHLFQHPDTTGSSSLKPVGKPTAVVGFVYPKTATVGDETDQRTSNENVAGDDQQLVEQLNQLNTANTEANTASTTNTNTQDEQGDIKLTLTELDTGNRTGDPAADLSSHGTDSKQQSFDKVDETDRTASDEQQEELKTEGLGGGEEGVGEDMECSKKDGEENSFEHHQEDEIGDDVEALDGDNDDGEEEVDGENDDDADDDGWITPANLSQAYQGMGGADEEVEDIDVGCMTTDFAMQNVLIQMGIPVLSVDGLRIRRAKSYVLRCYGCFKTTTNMNKKFCPSCGNQSMTKVSVSVDDSGNQQLYFSKRKTLNKRGLKYSLPMPHGGKHADNPFLVADQPVPQNRIPRKARINTDVFDPDFVSNASPFATKDVTSRSALLGTGRLGSGAGNNRRNPNQSRKKKGKKK